MLLKIIVRRKILTFFGIICQQMSLVQILLRENWNKSIIKGKKECQRVKIKKIIHQLTKWVQRGNLIKIRKLTTTWMI